MFNRAGNNSVECEIPGKIYTMEDFDNKRHSSWTPQILYRFSLIPLKMSFKGSSTPFLIDFVWIQHIDFPKLFWIWNDLTH